MSLDHENGGCDNVWACADFRCYLSRHVPKRTTATEVSKQIEPLINGVNMPGKGLIEKGGGGCSLCVSLNGLRRGRTNTCSHIPTPKPLGKDTEGHYQVAVPWDIGKATECRVCVAN